MKLFLLPSLLLLTNLALAQNNYIATSPASNTPGSTNTLVGISTGNITMTGFSNTFIGFASGGGNTTGQRNTYVGASSGSLNSVGNYNTFVGVSAGQVNNGDRNAFFGTNAGVSNTSGYRNTFVGGWAGFFNSTGNFNTFIGDDVGFSNATGFDNVFIGNSAGYNNNSGMNNVFLGFQAGYNNTIGQANVFIGTGAGYRNINGIGNLILGNQAGANITTASYNSFMGNGSGSGTTTGGDNTAIGDGAILSNTTGQRNTAIGKYAGINSQTGSDNVFIGFGAKAGNANPTNLNNAAAIGANAIVNQSNSIVLGNGVNVGIGNSAPLAKLHITAGAANTSGLRLENLTRDSPASIGNQTKFLTVDGSGNVIMASTGAARLAADSWSVSGDQLPNTNQGSVVIGKSNLKTPAGYKLVVEQGILTEKVKVAIKNTNEWSDYVFKPGYNLKSLTKVEQYIQEKGHLPGMLSAAEMVKQGNDLHQTDARLLAKIEELTLYSIQLEKRIIEEQKMRQQDRAEMTKLKQQHSQEINELKQLVKQVLEKK